MRLSEDRIHFIATQVAKELIDTKQIAFGGSRIVLESEIAKVILEDLRIEDEIDKEVVEMIDKMQRKVPHGSAEWQAIYTQKKEEIAKRRNYLL
jgi:hypothetical protein